LACFDPRDFLRVELESYPEEKPDQDIEVAYSCRAGQCGCCKAPLTKGKVEQSCFDGLKADDVEAGMILLCQARALGDVTLDN